MNKNLLFLISILYINVSIHSFATLQDKAIPLPTKQELSTPLQKAEYLTLFTPDRIRATNEQTLKQHKKLLKALLAEKETPFYVRISEALSTLKREKTA
jgi:hypothetical protein